MGKKLINHLTNWLLITYLNLKQAKLLSWKQEIEIILVWLFSNFNFKNKVVTYDSVRKRYVRYNALKKAQKLSRIYRKKPWQKNK